MAAAIRRFDQNQPGTDRAVGGEAGFVLPFALVVIASLSLVVAAAFAAVSRASALMQALDENSVDDLALASAEAQATFAFLTGVPVNEGLWLGRISGAGAEAAPESIAFGSALPPLSEEQLRSSEYWRADGAARAVATNARRVIVRYRDAAGLFHLVGARDESLAIFFQTFGFTRDAAVEMAARVGDYEDIDNVRRFRGAERTDYRLFRREPPSNSPLRTPEELGRVLGFFEAAPPGFWRELPDYATADQGVLLTYAAPARLAPLLPSRVANEGGLDVLAAATSFPSGRARFLLEVAGDARLRKRAVDIHRPPSVSQSAFQRYMIYETTEPATPAKNGDADLVPSLFASLGGPAQ